MRLLRSVRACIARCTLLHARTHVLWFGQYLQIIWQIITKHQSGWLAQILFQVSEIAAILGVPHPPRYRRAIQLQLSGKLSHSDGFALRIFLQPLHGLDGLSYGLGHSVLYGGDDAPLVIPITAGLVQKGVGSDEVKQGSKVTS